MKNLHYIFAVLTLSLGFSSCDDILDVSNTEQFSDAVIWNNPESADGYVMAAYNTFNDQSNFQDLNRKFYDAYTDLFKSTSWDAYEHLYNKTWMLTTFIGKNNAGSFASWSSAYGRIKRTNLLLNDIDRYGGKFGSDWQEIRRAEARFCNAINYWFIARVYGGAVIRTHNSGASGLTDDGAFEQDRNRARLSEAETYQYILDELQWAADRLPLKWEGRYNCRATKAVAYGFMSRIALYAKQWDVAVAAADNCKELGGYSLVDDYSHLFNCTYDNDNRKEVIYAIYGLDKIKTNEYDRHMRPFGDGATHNVSASAYARIVPTAELADMYDFADGTEFDWSTWKKVKDDSGKRIKDPFTFREPRFHATILYNGAQWEGREIQTYTGALEDIPNGTDYFVEYKNASSTGGHTCTGYYIRKYLMEGNKNYTVDNGYNTEIILRYAEVLLNKAEALAMQGNIKDALDPLNEVRARVNLPDIEITDVPDIDAFMKILRKERCCELAGEGLRFWDLRRWGIAKEVITQPVHGVLVVRTPADTYSYTPGIDADAGTPRIYQDRYDYFSLPADELTNNKLCVDNPNW